MISYTSQRIGFLGFLREARNLYRGRSENVPAQVKAVIEEMELVEARMKKKFGLALRDLDVLDIGAGQLMLQMLFLSRQNRVVGIDWDLIAQGLNPITYLQMCFLNGPRRTAKTISRKLLGIDRRYRREFREQLQMLRLPRMEVLRMDACKLAFPDAKFDFVHSRSVYHHLAKPEDALREVARVLRPGGAAYIGFHLFTSENGALDPRVWRDEAGKVVLWPHLRPEYAPQMQSNAYLNKYRLGRWQEICAAEMPGCELILNRSHRPGIQEDAKALVEGGWLQGYSVEELVVHDVVILWRKPSGSEVRKPGVGAMPA